MRPAWSPRYVKSRRVRLVRMPSLHHPQSPSGHSTAMDMEDVDMTTEPNDHNFPAPRTTTLLI